MAFLRVTDFWRGGETYVSTNRYRPLVVHNNKFYICIETHVATEVWEDNEDKFVAMSASGGGSSLVPQGEWDVANSTELGPFVTTIPEYTTLYDANNTNGVLTPAGNNTYTLSVFTFFGGDCRGIVNNFSTTKWLTIPKPIDSKFVTVFLYDINGVTNPINELITPLISNTNPTVKSIAYVMVNLGGSWGVGSSVNIPGQPALQYLLNIEPLADVAYGYNSTTNKVYISGYAPLTETSIPTGFFDGAEIGMLVSSIYGAGLVGSGISVTYPNQNIFPPILQGGQSTVVTPPLNAMDGELWNVTSNGTYNFNDLLNGDSVIFYNNLQDIIKISGSDISTAIDTAIDTSITTELSTNGRITDKINEVIETRGLLSYGGDWNATSFYDGNINFVENASAQYSNDFFTSGGGTLFGDNLWYNVLLASDVQYDGANSIEFAFTIPSMSIDSELFIDVRLTGELPIAYDSSSYKYARLSIVNLDNTGTDNNQYQISLTYSDGLGGTLTPTVAGFLSSVGDRIGIQINSGVYIENKTKTNSAYLSTSGLGHTAQGVDIYVAHRNPNSYTSVTFLLTQGIKKPILPPEPRINKTYLVSAADFSSIVYTTPVHKNDYVTFIDSGGLLSVQVTPKSSQEYTARYGNFIDYRISNGNIPAVIKIINVNNTYLSNPTLDCSNISIIRNVTGVEYTNSLEIYFNKFAGDNDALYVANNYTANSVYQITFDTTGGAITNVVFRNTNTIPILHASIPIGKIVTYSFMVFSNYQYGITIQLINVYEG